MTIWDFVCVFFVGLIIGILVGASLLAPFIIRGD